MCWRVQAYVAQVWKALHMTVLTSPLHDMVRGPAPTTTAHHTQ
jgi:hypothetical protein